MLLPNHCSGRNNGHEWREVVENACSYQALLITIEIKDVDEDRRKIFHGISQAVMWSLPKSKVIKPVVGTKFLFSLLQLGVDFLLDRISVDTESMFEKLMVQFSFRRWVYQKG